MFSYCKNYYEKSFPNIIAFSKRLARLADIALLLIHAVFLILFLLDGAAIMYIANICSVLFYFFAYFLIENRLSTFLTALFIEILSHMLLAMYCVGWSYGFQYYCFGLIPVVFCCFYLSRQQRVRTLPPLTVSIIISLLYLLMNYLRFVYTPLYTNMNITRQRFLFSLNLGIVLLCIAAFMTVYTRLVISSEHTLRHVAEHDPLTQIYNRRKMQSILDALFQTQHKESTAEPAGSTDPASAGDTVPLRFSIAILDIDDFKKVNDTYGHNGGDYILTSIADRLRFYAKKHSGISACRWGGEEFLILSVGSSCSVALNEMCMTIRSGIASAHFCYQDREIPLSVTIGTADYSGEASIDELFRRADKHLYQGKAMGKNCLITDHSNLPL